MLEKLALPQLNEDFGENLIPQQDGATPHYHNSVTRFLNENLPDNGSRKTWPPRSSDLMPMDFFLWSCIKNQVYAHLCQRIIRNSKTLVNTTASYSRAPRFTSRPGDRLSWGFSSVRPGECQDSTLKLSHDRFLPNTFQFMIHFPFHSLLYSLSYWKNVVYYKK
jgi:hypothetical protein